MIRSAACMLLTFSFLGSGCFADTTLGEADTTASTTTEGDSESTTGENLASCDDYCSFVSACDSDFPQYAAAGPCDSVCQRMPLGTLDDQTGNTVGCRTFYAVQSGEGTADKEQFCQNAGPAGNGVCGGLCESFCAIAIDTCVDANQVYASTIDCTTACMGWDTTEPYSSMSMEADTYACRLKHLTYATRDPDTHCSHVADVSPVCTNP